MKFWLVAAALAVSATSSEAAPHVWLDTDQGPIVLELDPQAAPLTTAHFRAIVDSGFFDGLVFHRTIRNFMIQGGWINSNFNIQPRDPNPTVNSEANNGLPNIPGSIALALPSGNNNGGTTQFFINTVRNANLDADFTVFGHVVHGMPVVEAIGNGATTSTTLFSAQGAPLGTLNDVPRRLPTIRRAVSSDGFPIMNLHTGAWFEPAASGRGFSIEIAHAAGAEDNGPLLVVYWYDYSEGRQIWMTGATTFAYGASEVTIPLQITDGGQFGAGYDPEAVARDNDFGSLTLSFPACNRAHARYQTRLGNGELELQRLTIPGNDRCQ